MPVEMAIWKMTDTGPQPLKFTPLGLESRLESMVVADPSLIGVDLLVIGRQVRTEFGGIIDILAVDSEAHLHVLELKRDRTPREIVAQALDYGSWTQSLTLDQVSGLYAEQHEEPFDQAFAERFSAPVPDVFNADQQLTIVASDWTRPLSESSATYRIVTRYQSMQCSSGISRMVQLSTSRAHGYLLPKRPKAWPVRPHVVKFAAGTASTTTSFSALHKTSPGGGRLRGNTAS